MAVDSDGEMEGDSRNWWLLEPTDLSLVSAAGEGSSSEAVGGGGGDTSIEGLPASGRDDACSLMVVVLCEWSVVGAPSGDAALMTAGGFASLAVGDGTGSIMFFFVFGASYSMS